MQWVFRHLLAATMPRSVRLSSAIAPKARCRMSGRRRLGLPEDLIGTLSSPGLGLVGGRRGTEACRGAEPRLADRLRLTLDLARQLMGAPRHLSQHPGGFVLTHDEADDLVPIEPAAMKDRQVIEWDKDDIDALKFMKVDAWRSEC